LGRVQRERLLAAALAMAVDDVDRDAIQPGVSARLPAELAEPLKGAHRDLLSQIFRGIPIAGQPRHQQRDARLVLRPQPRKAGALLGSLTLVGSNSAHLVAQRHAASIRLPSITWIRWRRR